MSGRASGVEWMPALIRAASWPRRTEWVDPISTLRSVTTSHLLLAEALANCGWLVEGNSGEDLQHQIVTICREAYLAPPALLSAERTARVRAVLLHLAERWRGLKPKGAIQLHFDSQNPVRGFDEANFPLRSVMRPRLSREPLCVKDYRR